MKKLIISLMTIATFSLGFSSQSSNYTTKNFTFIGYNENSKDSVSVSPNNINLGGSSITFPVFGDNALVIKNMNKEMEKFIKKYKGTNNKQYELSYEIKGSNDLFISFLFSVNEKNLKTNEIKTHIDTISFNVRNGEKISLNDILLPGYQNSLNGVISDKIKQFGIETISDKKNTFKGVQKNQKFYLEDDALVLVYNENEATNFADGKLYIPFLFVELIGLLR